MNWEDCLSEPKGGVGEPATGVHGRSLLWKVMQAAAKEGHRWRRRILTRFTAVYNFSWHLHEGTVKTKFVFQLTFWVPDCFLHLILYFLGLALAGETGLAS